MKSNTEFITFFCEVIVMRFISTFFFLSHAYMSSVQNVDFLLSCMDVPGTDVAVKAAYEYQNPSSLSDLLETKKV